MAQLKPPPSPITRAVLVCISTLPKVKSWDFSVDGWSIVLVPFDYPEQVADWQAKQACN